jgi:hypothetical protein
MVTSSNSNGLTTGRARLAGGEGLPRAAGDGRHTPAPPSAAIRKNPLRFMAAGLAPRFVIRVKLQA